MASRNTTHICKNCQASFLGKKLQQFCGKDCSDKWSKGRLNVGVVRSADTRKKIGEKTRGRVDKPETTIRRRESHLGPRHYRWNPDREAQLLKNKLGHFCRKLVERSLKGDTKTGRSFPLLGYTPAELRAHLESMFEPWMNWSNWGVGTGKWQVDHIRLVSSFPAGTPPAIINALSNLRPLSYEENMRRPKFERFECQEI